MPINVYTGLMRSGKSYEVVSEVIVPAIRRGRRVVTNVDGISQDRIREYLKAKHPDDDAGLYGSIIHVSNDQVFDPLFFPYYDDEKGAHTDTTVQPGDLVCIDEAWRFWGASDCKIHKNHKSFFLEHGHFINEQTRVACDLVLMIQDMNTLNRFVKAVVAFNFRTHKKVALGLSNTYSVTMWEGYKQGSSAKIGSWVRKYKKEVFPLYSSFKGGGEGVLVNADSRQNVFANRKLWTLIAVLVVGAAVSAYNIWKFFHPAPVDKRGKPLPAVGESPVQQQPTAPASIVASAGARMGQQFSDVWRVSGTLQSKGIAWVIVVNQSGLVRLESPSVFAGSGMVLIGDVDGAKATSWSGWSAIRNVPTSVATNPVPISEVRK